MDILLFAGITFALVFYYKSLIGKPMNGEDPAMRAGKAIAELNNALRVTPKAVIDDSLPKSLATVLHAIQGLEPSFNEKSFLIGAKKAFTKITENYNAGNLNQVSGFITPRVKTLLEQHSHDVAPRTVEKINVALLLNASLEGKTANITVEFHSFQVLDDEHQEELVDTWTFTRTLGSNEMGWKLAAVS